MINIYAGYYELFVTDKQLKEPYMLIYSSDKKTEILQQLNNCDDWILADNSLIDWIDFYNASFNVKNGLPVITDEPRVY